MTKLCYTQHYKLKMYKNITEILLIYHHALL